MEKAYQKGLLILLLLLLPVPALAQEIDWKPIAVNTFGQLWDVVGTERFLDHREERITEGKHGCVEGNSRYWGYNGFTSESPDMRKVWRDKILFISAISGWQILVEKTRLRHHSKLVRWGPKIVGYYAGGRTTFAAIRNGMRCGF